MFDTFIILNVLEEGITVKSQLIFSTELFTFRTVPLQLSSPSKREVTLIAAERFFSTVHNHVILQVSCCGARVVALLAHERLFSTVGEFVSL